MDYNEYMQFGRSYKAQGQLAQAIDSFQQAFILKPRNEEALREIISGFYEAGEPAQALLAYEAFAYWLSEADERPEEETTALYKALCGKILEAFYGFMQKGWQHNRSKNFTAALAEFVSAMKLQPRNDSVVSAIMNTLYSLGRFDEGARIYEDFANALHLEKGLSPDPITTQLYIQMKIKAKEVK